MVSMQRWVGKVAVVTGASSGIGAAIADALVKNGLIVVGVARRAELIEDHAKQLSGEKGKLHAFKADITQEEELLNLFKWVSTNLGPVHILINNAGKESATNLTDGKTEDWKSVFDLNVMALCVATREAVKIMKKNKINGHIIHVNSLLGHQVLNYPKSSVYPASKFAVTALTETLRQELSRLGLKIKITSVSPGLVETELFTSNLKLKPEREALVKKLPILKASDVADAVVYALSTPEHIQIQELTFQSL